MLEICDLKLIEVLYSRHVSEDCEVNPAAVLCPRQVLQEGGGGEGVGGQVDST